MWTVKTSLKNTWPKGSNVKFHHSVVLYPQNITGFIKMIVKLSGSFAGELLLLAMFQLRWVIMQWILFTSITLIWQLLYNMMRPDARWLHCQEVHTIVCPHITQVPARVLSLDTWSLSRPSLRTSLSNWTRPTNYWSGDSGTTTPLHSSNRTQTLWSVFISEKIKRKPGEVSVVVVNVHSSVMLWFSSAW